MIRIERFSGSSSVWDRFVADSANATFLLSRGYMDYHADRFTDFSLAAYRDNSLVALLPANILSDDALLQSHGGLTYGGWIIPQRHFNTAVMLEVFHNLLQFCKAEGIRAIDYKPIPHIYHTIPAEDDIYALFRCGATLTECNVSSTINLSQPLHFNQMQRRHLKSALAIPGLRIVESDDIVLFWQTLHNCLLERHATVPVHTTEELRLLKNRFPDNIRLFMASTPEGALAGVLIYDTGIVAHAQYIATNKQARDEDLLTPLFHELITRTFADRRFFDFGISNEKHGTILNEGLLSQKTSLGGSATVYQRFRIDI